MEVQLSSVLVKAEDNTTQRVGSIRVSSSAGASLDALLVGQSTRLLSDTGVAVPQPPAEGWAPSSGPSAAELVFDSLSRLRMLNFSMASISKLSLSDMSKRVGFSWPSTGSASTDPISFSAPWLYYVPSMPGAPSISWSGKKLQVAELGVAATVDVPSLGINATRGSLLIRTGGLLQLQVSLEPTAPYPFHLPQSRSDQVTRSTLFMPWMPIILLAPPTV